VAAGQRPPRPHQLQEVSVVAQTIFSRSGGMLRVDQHS
jgi:hypothetical protein